VSLFADDGRIARSAIARARGAGEESPQMRVFPSGKPLNPMSAEVIARGEALMIPDVNAAWLKKLIGANRHISLLHSGGPRSLMMIPLLSHERVSGLICLAGGGGRRRYNDRDLALAKELASRAVLALDNAQLFQQSREATRLRDEVLRVVAHDLRGPLNTISMSADLLHMELQPERVEWKNQLEIITRSVSYADRLIEDLLDVARMQAGKLVLDKQSLDPRALIEETIELQQPLAAQHHIHLRSTASAQLPRIAADPHRVQQVLANLIGNAVKFSAGGTTILVDAAVHNGAIRFSVKDQGRGIQPSDLPHLFDPFWQARAGVGGAGLGLAVCKGIVKAHGGQIWVDSAPGKGSTFSFTLPIGRTGRSKAA
jgi:signal transduction histidine kinase